MLWDNYAHESQREIQSAATKTQCSQINKAPLSMEFSTKEYWSGLPFPSPGDFSNPGIKPGSPALAGGFFTTELPGKLLTSDKSVHLSRH